jgi:hypothetical protein
LAEGKRILRKNKSFLNEHEIVTLGLLCNLIFTTGLDRFMNYSIKKVKQSFSKATFDLVTRPLAILFIFLLSAQCIFKLGIITFFEANRDYIADVFCINKEKEITTCYGKCFLDRNLTIADEGTDDSTPSPRKSQIESSIFTLTRFDMRVKRYFLLESRISSPQPLYTFDQVSTLFHPPC